jgi:hypothetical protein
MLRFDRFLLLAAAPLLGLVGAPAQAESVDTKGVTACAISGWSADRDPAGLNVRAAARKDAPVIGVLPHQPDYPVEFEIIGSLNGWLLIRNARALSYSDAPDRKVFAGPGWIFADKVQFEINDLALRAQPQANAPVVLPLHNADYSEGPDSAAVDHVYGCQGAFADVEVHMPEGPHKRGWATRICSNQVTTCS